MQKIGARENKVYCALGSSVIRLGDILDFVQLFKVFGNN